MKAMKIITTIAVVVLATSMFAQETESEIKNESPKAVQAVTPQKTVQNEAVLIDQQQPNPEVGGAQMSPAKNIVENAVNSKDHTTLVAAVEAAGLVETLSSSGPFTVFAPTNEAFEALPEGTVANLLKEENKKQLQTVLTYHVVPGRLDSKAILNAIQNGGGSAVVQTIESESLTLTSEYGKVYVTDAKGNKGEVTIADVYQSNGVIHVVNKVLLPKE